MRHDGVSSLSSESAVSFFVQTWTNLYRPSGMLDCLWRCCPALCLVSMAETCVGMLSLGRWVRARASALATMVSDEESGCCRASCSLRELMVSAL
jgi:hypothetical protein